MAQSVKEVMTADPVTVEPGASVVDAARLMTEHDVGVVVVRSSGSVRGLVTDRDPVVRAIADGRDGERTHVEEVCSGDLLAVSPDDGPDRAVEKMRGHSVRGLPVVERGRAVGILSIGDLAIEQDRRSALADISAAPPNR